MKSNKDIEIKKNREGKKTILCDLEKTHIEIFNAWGQKIFESTGLDTGGIALLVVKK